MNQQELDKCLEIIKDYMSENDMDPFFSESNLAKMACSGVMEYTGGGTISKMIKAYPKDGSESIFGFQYENFDVDGKVIYNTNFVYGNYTEIRNPTLALFEFAFKDCINNLK